MTTNTFNNLTEKVEGHNGTSFTKSRGTIIDILSNIEGQGVRTTEHIWGLNTELSKRYLRVPSEFIKKFPELSQDKANKYYNDYLQILRQLLIKRTPYINSSYAHISLDKLWTLKFQYKGNTYYHYKEFSEHRPFFYAPDDKKGNGRKRGQNFEKNSEIYIMNQKLIDLLIDSGDVNELVSLYYGDINTDTKLDTVPIDINSLTNFINNTVKEIEKSEKNTKHELTLYRNLRQAKYIKVISIFFSEVYGEPVLPMIQNMSVYGRMYYKGINIQNISKTVRKACLGDHHSYDLNAAVYSIKLMLAKDILKQYGISDYGHFTYTKEYLDYKNPIRKELAKHITAYSNGEKLVKEAITAIGFGARIGGGSWQVDGEWHTSSIEDIIMNRKDRENFMNDPWIKKFVREQQSITNIITNEFIDDKAFNDKVSNIPTMFKNGKLRRTQVMSYVFQHTEKMIMDQITLNIPVIARVHDSFITKNKLSNAQITEIKYQLNSFEPLMTIDNEDFRAWTSNDEDDESDIDLAFSKLTGVYHTRPNIKLSHTHRYFETFNDGKVSYPKYIVQTEYDPENDSYVEAMTHAERREHYRILGYNPNTDDIPEDIRRLL